MGKCVKVSDKVHKKLTEKKGEFGAKTYSEVVNILLREFDERIH